MGGRSGQSISIAGKAKITSSSLSGYEDIVNSAIKEFGITGEILVSESKLNVGGYAGQNLRNFDNGGNPFRNEIFINPKKNYGIEKIIRHELKHISQGQKGDYYSKKVDGVRYQFWKGKKIISSEDFNKINRNLHKGNNFAKYQSLPWERDARSVE